MSEPGGHTADGAAGPYSVGTVARLAGVTVRTLHHYDEIGLLRPSERTPAGYRSYSADDTDRLRRILSYRELGFGLDEIADILADGDATAHLRRQHELLPRRIEKLRRMAASVDGVRAMDLVERHRLHIVRWYYDCGHEIQRSLAEMYVATRGSPKPTRRTSAPAVLTAPPRRRMDR